MYILPSHFLQLLTQWNCAKEFDKKIIVPSICYKWSSVQTKISRFRFQCLRTPTKASWLGINDHSVPGFWYSINITSKYWKFILVHFMFFKSSWWINNSTKPKIIKEVKSFNHQSIYLALWHGNSREILQ